MTRSIYKPDPAVLARLRECAEVARGTDTNTPEQKAELRAAVAREMARAEERRKPTPQLDLAA